MRSRPSSDRVFLDSPSGGSSVATRCRTVLRIRRSCRSYLAQNGHMNRAVIRPIDSMLKPVPVAGRVDPAPEPRGRAGGECPPR